VVDSPESLKSCIDKVMSMEEAELIKMGEAARARVEKMAPEIIYQQVYELYQRTCSAPRCQDIISKILSYAAPPLIVIF